MPPLRKMSEVWNSVDGQRGAKIGNNEWRRSHQGIQAALKSIGIVLVTSKKELDAMDVPTDTNGNKKYTERHVDVSRNGEIWYGKSIQNLLTGQSSLRTKEERKAIWTAVGEARSIAQPKGIPSANNVESNAVDDLDRLIGVSDHMSRKHLVEFRAYDIAYAPIGAVKDDDVFVADQVKTSTVGKKGLLQFHANERIIRVSDMISILKNGSLTCIGRTREGVVDVVWFFTSAAIDTLQEFEMDPSFTPVLHLKQKNKKPFTIAMQSDLFRFDVGKSKKECDRLLQAKIDFLAAGKKNSLKFWNEDMSQIPSVTHQVEQQSMTLMQDACVANGANFEKPHSIMYGPIDFLINGVRVQDKAMAKKKIFHVRAIGRLPYNPDELDVFQVTDLERGLSYVMSMRVVNPDDTVTSFYPAETLMKENIGYGPKWQEIHKQFKHDLNTPEGTKSYVEACIAAGKIAPLTDRTFYKKMCDDNRDMFGSKRQLAERKLKNTK